jgi:hypothetical protein
VFERFTDRARRVVVLAQEQARLLNHNFIGTEHLLLGLLQAEGVGAKVLESLDVSQDVVRRKVTETVGQGGDTPTGHVPFTPRAKKVLELSLREAIGLGHNYIGTEHILLGLVREGEGVAATVLVSLGADLDRVRAHVIEALSGHQPGPRDLPPPESQPQGVVRAIAARQAMVFGASPSTHCSFCGRDLWEVDHYVIAAGASICDGCVAASRDALDRADASDAAAWGPVHLPPRVFGAEPPEPGAIAAVEHAFRTVFSDSSSDEIRADALEDGSQLKGTLAEARQRAPAVGPVRVQVQRVRFLDDSHAQVGFAILLGAGGGPSFEGHAVRTDVWRVSRDTFCRVVAMAGVRCPPAGGQPE